METLNLSSLKKKTFYLDLGPLNKIMSITGFKKESLTFCQRPNLLKLTGNCKTTEDLRIFFQARNIYCL